MRISTDRQSWKRASHSNGVGTDRNRGLDLIYGEDWTPVDVTRYNHKIIIGGRYVTLFGGRHSKR